MALTQVKSDGIATGAVTADQIATGAVTANDLEDSGVTAGTYGSSSAIPAITVDAKGRITSASTNSIDSTSISNGTSNVSVAASGDITASRAGTQRLAVTSTGINVTGTVDADFLTADGLTVDANVLHVDSTNDRVGIGLTSPANTLHVRGPVSGTILNLDRGGSYSWKFGQSSGSHLTITGDTAERFRFGPDGQLGIGGANYGTSGQVLTSQGSGSAPQWATPSSGGITWLSPENTGAGGGAITTTGIDTDSRMIVISFFAVSQSTSSTNQLTLRVGNGSINTANNYRWSISRGNSYDASTSASYYRLLVSAYSNASSTFTGNITLLRTDDGSNLWSIVHQLFESNGNEPINGAGSYQGSAIDRIQIIPAGNFDNGRFRVGYIL